MFAEGDDDEFENSVEFELDDGLDEVLVVAVEVVEVVVELDDEPDGQVEPAGNIWPFEHCAGHCD